MTEESHEEFGPWWFSFKCNEPGMSELSDYIYDGGKLFAPYNRKGHWKQGWINTWADILNGLYAELENG